MSFPRAYAPTESLVSTIQPVNAGLIFRPDLAQEDTLLVKPQSVAIEASNQYSAHQSTAAESIPQVHSDINGTTCDHHDSACRSGHAPVTEAIAEAPASQSSSLNPDLQTLGGVRTALDALQEIEDFLVHVIKKLDIPDISRHTQCIVERLEGKLCERKRLIKGAAYTWSTKTLG